MGLGRGESREVERGEGRAIFVWEDGWLNEDKVRVLVGDYDSGEGECGCEWWSDGMW